MVRITRKAIETIRQRSRCTTLKIDNMKTIIPKETPIPQLFGTLLSAIGPRPIAFASTVDKDGNPNLAPFSFFNIFGANPPTLVFSPSRRGRDNTTKDTYNNVKEVAEVVINVVNYQMVQQVSLASNEFPTKDNEFIKAGFTPIPSDLIKPFRVKESPVHLECKVNQVIETGTEGAAGNLVICEILKIHIDESILDENGKIDQQKIDLVGRMGGDFYCRASGDSIFEVLKPGATPGIGIDKLPDNIKNSTILTGNDLGQMGSLLDMPTKADIDIVKNQSMYKNLKSENDKHILAKELIQKGDAYTALCLLS